LHYLECTITDNGIGRARAEEVNKAQRDALHKSTALLVTQERLDRMNPDLTFKTLEIKDLFDSEGHAAGTQVILRIPV
jgi:hypothetical protein